MSIASFALLDQAELLQLALSAGAANDAGAAISYLKEAVSRPDASAVAHYVLGAEYAQIKMFDRAIGEMESAIALDPALSVARLQLGLLWLTSGDAARADTVLQVLAELGEHDPLRHFGVGLCHLIKDQFAPARASLAEGIALNQANAPLNVDMQRIIDQIAGSPAADAAGGAPLADAQPDTEPTDARHIFLSAYTGN